MYRWLALTALVFCTATPNLAHAILVNVKFDKLTPTSTSGTITKTPGQDQTGATTGSPANVRYSVTGLTIDSIGMADDSIAFTFRLTGTGNAGILGFGSAGSVWGVNSPEAPPENAHVFDRMGESMNLSLVNSSVTLGAGATEIGAISFDGFTGFELKNFNPNGNVRNRDRYNLAGTSADGTAKSTASVSFAPTPTFTLSYNSGNGFSVDDIGARFSVVSVPEPSAFLFGGLVCGVLGVNYARKRKASEAKPQQ